MDVAAEHVALERSVSTLVCEHFMVQQKGHAIGPKRDRSPGQNIGGTSAQIVSLSHEGSVANMFAGIPMLV